MNELAERVTKAVLDTLKRGGDHYNIYVTVKAALAASPLRGRLDIAKIIDPDAKWGEVIEAGSNDDNQIMLALEKADAILSPIAPATTKET